MAKIYKIKYTKEVCEKLLNNKLKRKDYEGVLSIGYYNIYKLKFEPCYMYIAMAIASFHIEEYAKAINFWFLYLANCEEGEKPLAYNGLGACFYRMDNKELAGYYFNKQLSFKKRAPYEFDDVFSEFIDDVTSVKDKYYIAYPFNKANFDNLISKVLSYIKAGYYEKALIELEVIPSDSKYYVDALIQKSLCKYLTGKTEEALKDISLAVELDGENAVALLNAISMFYASGKTAETKKLLETLTASKDYRDVENAEKVALIYCELKDYITAEEFFDKGIKEYQYNLRLLFLNGITKYNLGKYSEALELFLKCNRLSNSYVNSYYVKIAENAINKEKNGRKILNLDYTFDVQSKEYKRITKRFDKFLQDDVYNRREQRELNRLFDYAYEKCDMKLLSKMLSILNKMDDDYAIRIAIKYLLRVDMLDNVKRSLIALIVYKGFNSNLSFVYGNRFHDIEIKQPKIPESLNVLKEAYAICVSKLAGLEKDIYDVTVATENVAKAVENGLNPDLFEDVFSLSAVLFEISGLKNIKSRRAFLEYFEANQRRVKKYKELIHQFGGYLNGEDFFKLVEELGF